jgi:hypothetical protein
MRYTLLVLLLPIAQDPQPETKPTLPAVRKVTLTFDKTPAADALRKLVTASGFRVHYQAGRDEEDHGLQGDEMTLNLDAVPFVEAVPRFCQAHKEIGFSFESGFVKISKSGPLNPPVACYGDLFGFEITKIEERLATDFGSELRQLSIELFTWWQPDLQVFRVVGATIDEAADDKGNDLRIPDSKPTDPHFLRLVLPPKAATAIALLRGSLIVEVPGDVVECVLQNIDQDAIAPVTIERCIVAGKRSLLAAGPCWEITVKPAAKGDTLLGLAEPRVVRKSGKPAEEGQAAGFRSDFFGEHDDCGLWFTDAPGGDVEKLAFKIVKSKARMKVGFEFKNVKLPRTK